MTTVQKTLKAYTDEKTLAGALEQIDECIIVTSVNGTITYVNRSFEKVTGYSRDEVIGKNPNVLKSDEHSAEFYKEIWNTLLDGGVWRGRFINKMKDGSLRNERATICPLLDDNGEIVNFISLSFDITKEIDLEMQLRRSQKLEAIGQLASGIAHEINTPTQYIGDNLHFFKESFEGLHTLLHKYNEVLARARNNESLDEALSEIEKLQAEIDLEFLLEETPSAIDRSLEGNNRVAEVVRAMKEFAHPSAENVMDTDINHAIETTVAVARNEWKYVAELVTNFDPNLGLVPLLPGAFNQVILNLIVNASHAIAEALGDRPSEKGRITIETKRQADVVEIRVSDTGTGIPEKIRQKIFDPFFTTKGIGKGTGQGLAIAHSVIVETHNGSLDVESEIGKGTTFYIRIPLAPNGISSK